MSKLAFIGIAFAFLATSCGSGPIDAMPTSTPTPTPTPAVTVSDAVPPVEELMTTGLTEEQAECFRAAIDPDGDGIVNIDLFAEALACQ